MIEFATRDEMLTAIPKRAVIAELGVFTGAFSTVILKVCEPAELHLIDLWEGRVQCGDRNGENVQIIDDLALVYLALALRGDPRYVLHRGTTVEVLKTFADDYFDFIYVDADHSEEAVYNDLKLASKKALWGIGGHDLCPQFPGVEKAVNRFLSESGWHMTHRTTDDKCPSYILQP
jgi:hypothetical protein